MKKDESILAGRAADMIIRGGENISSEEAKDVACCFHKIDEMACIGVPDPEWGQD
jgi:acyl-CoA synthetase (AMP-forming)/AMP-acid ligase II